jgi:AraC-like DNA-binding protein
MRQQRGPATSADRQAAPVPPAARGATALARRLAPDLRLVESSGQEAEPLLTFRHRRLHLGDLAVHRLAFGRCRLTLGSEERICLLLPLTGEATVWPGTGGRRPALTADADHGAVLMPPGTFQLRSERVQLLLITVPCRRLSWAAERLAGPRAAARMGKGLTRWRQWRREDPGQAERLELLHQTLRLLESADPRTPSPSPSGEALESWILQTLALLMLLEPEESGGGDGMALSDARIEALIAYIEANLHRPLSLQELSECSGYSRRSLQYAFQRRFGCGPMQWVRQRRLEAAREALQGASPTETVRRIARRCGYINLSSFSRDIQKTFGRTPSALRPGGLWAETQ